MPLTTTQKKHLRRLAHPLHPIVAVGKKGLVPAVINELDAALTAHELVKVRARTIDRETCDELLAQLAQQTQSELAHRIGYIGVLYRPRKDTPRIILPDA